MNALSHGLLALLSSESLTGYDLMLKINKFSRITHSSVYPLLSDLEKQGMVEYTIVNQTNKPDKKVYSLTEKGISTVIQWFNEPTDRPILRDTMLFKINCFHLMDKESILMLLDEREAIYRDLLDIYSKKLEEIELENGTISKDLSSPLFNKYILSKKIATNASNEIEWCNWVRSLYI